MMTVSLLSTHIDASQVFGHIDVYNGVTLIGGPIDVVL